MLADVGNLVHSVYVFHPPPRADLAPRRVCVISSALTLSWYPHHGRCAAVAGSGRDVTLPLTLALGSRKDDHTCEAAGRLGPHPAAAGNTGRCLGSRRGAAALVAPAPGVHSTGRLAAHRRRADAGDCRAAGARPGLAGGAATAGHPGVHGSPRNPIYLGCGAVHLGLAGATRNAWMLATWPVSAALLHRAVLREERLAAREVRRRVRGQTRVARYTVPECHRPG